MKTVLIIISVSFLCIATQWQPPIQQSYPGGTPCFTNDNQKMYVTVVDGSPASDNIGYNNWNGSSWVWGGDVTGDIRTATYIEKEPFIAYDNQIMYFVRAGIAGDFSAIYRATREGSTEVFNGSTALGSQINNINGQPYACFPSITQDQQKLYFCARPNSYWKIYEATWNGSDWDNVTLLPYGVNEGESGRPNRTNVCITPDGNELYFQIADDIYGSHGKLAYSKMIGGIWQQWQYCDNNINPINVLSIWDTAFTYSSYETQELYFGRQMIGSSYGYEYHALRSPITVQPTSLGSIKAIYGSK